MKALKKVRRKYKIRRRDIAKGTKISLYKILIYDIFENQKPSVNDLIRIRNFLKTKGVLWNDLDKIIKL